MSTFSVPRPAGRCMKLLSLHSTDGALTLHDIHGLNKKGADEGENQGEIFPSGSDGENEGGRRDEEKDPIKPCVFLLIFHSMGFVTDVRSCLKICTKLSEMAQKEKSMQLNVYLCGLCVLPAILKFLRKHQVTG